MRLLIQRVKEAKVTVDQEVVGSIDKGLLVFFAVHKEDSAKRIPWLAEKLVSLRIFSDSEDKMNLSVRDVGGEILIVSQFTLYGDCRKGRRPSFDHSAKGPHAKELYQAFVEEVKNRRIQVQTGRFAAKMEVSLVNDGPITLSLDS